MNINTKRSMNVEENRDEKQEESPFKIYEEKYCNKCGDYRGCLGLIDSMSMEIEKSKDYGKSDVRFDPANKIMGIMGGMAFASRFKLLLDCMAMRKYHEGM